MAAAIDLEGPPGNRSAIGAEIEVHACGLVQRRTVSAARSYQSAMPATAIFGLGSCERIDKVIVRWPDGRTSAHERIRPRQRITLRP